MMNTSQSFQRLGTIFACSAAFVISGCGPTAFQRHREAGRQRYKAGQFAAARAMFIEAYRMVPENADNLCDVANCYMGLARQYLIRENLQAATREIDGAIGYYDRAIQSFPGCNRALQGKNTALEMRGASVEALRTAEWASKVVGPSVEQQLFFARELAERGDADRAMLAYKQAIAMEASNPTPHRAIGLFYINIGKRDQAITHLQESYRLDPSQTVVAETLKRLGAEVPEVANAELQPE